MTVHDSAEDYGRDSAHRGLVHALSEKEEAICEAGVAVLLKKGAIRLVPDGSKGFVASFFSIKKPKTLDEYRPIAELKPLNTFIQYEHFKMEGLDTVRFLLQPGDYMIKSSRMPILLRQFTLRIESSCVFSGRGVFTNLLAWRLAWPPPLESLQSC